ncbi:hypothetical protein [Neolewinella antarctica]|uniref:Uncharacterized protein n=1 Tax=Neolewinella antarctica TaxID=442734 RepID=A0ABX0XDT1_9BACT|nr:hypothetical protein [Neolewinella antarctica]NJC27064.1 hypothetical protein [Neolewinella antarctica]
MLSLLIATYLFPDFTAGGWFTTVVYALAVVIFGMIGLEIYNVNKLSGLGQFYVLRNFTFYGHLATLVVVVGIVLMGLLRDDTSGADTFPFAGLVALLFGYASQTYSYVYLDSVVLRNRIGTTTNTIPLFNIDRAEESDEGLYVTSNDGGAILIERGNLSAENYAALREGLLD